jgi:hypothetical protein
MSSKVTIYFFAGWERHSDDHLFCTPPKGWTEPKDEATAIASARARSAGSEGRSAAGASKVDATAFALQDRFASCGAIRFSYTCRYVNTLKLNHFVLPHLCHHHDHHSWSQVALRTMSGLLPTLPLFDSVSESCPN